MGGIFAWLVSVPMFGGAWVALASSAHRPVMAPVYLFLSGHALGLLAGGPIADVWEPLRGAGLRWAAPSCLALTIVTAFAPLLAPVSFPLMGLLAAWGIVSWAPAFQALVALRRRALSFAWVPVGANAVKYLLSLGLGHLSPQWLVILAAMPLLVSLWSGARLAKVGRGDVPASAQAWSITHLDLRPLWLLAPFLFIVYLAAGVTYSAVTPSLLQALHSAVDPSLLSYVVCIPLLALLGDRTNLRNVAILGPLLLGSAFLVWAVSPTYGGALATEGMMGAGYAAMDLLTWVALLEIAPPHATATVFGIGLNTNVLPILIGAGLQAQVPALAHLPSASLAGGMIFLMLVAVVFLREQALLLRPRGADGRIGERLKVPQDLSETGGGSAPVLLSEAIGTRMAAISSWSLSPRELEVACLLIQGRSVSEVAQDLVVSENTVKTHLANIYRKTHTRGRAELSAKVLVGAGAEIGDM